MIIVFGATGLVGRSLTACLRDRSAHFACAVRDPVRAARMLPAETSCMSADMAQDESIALALANAQTVFLLSSHGPEMDTHQKAVVRAAVAASRQSVQPLHIVKLSGGPYLRRDPNVCVSRQHLAIESAIHQSGLPFTILRPAFFFQNLLKLAPRIASKRELTAPFGAHRIAMVDAADVAVAAANILMAPGRHAGTTYTLTRDKAWQMKDVALQMSETFGCSIRYRSPPAWLAGVAQRLSGVGREEVQHNLEMVRQIYRKDLGEETSFDLIKLLGRSPTPLREFLAQHQAKFLTGKSDVTAQDAPRVSGR